MKLVSFNVNGIRASVKKGLADSLSSHGCGHRLLPGNEGQPDQVAEALADVKGYHLSAYSAEKAGYSGTAILSREEPVRVDHGIGGDDHNTEGRVITATFADHIVVNAYIPNSGQGLKRLEYRQQWDIALREYLVNLASGKRPVIFTGDLNVAHQPMDIARPKANYNKTAGYTQQEIDGMSALLGAGFTDTFRHFHPEVVKYSWWSQRFGAREQNIGWRLDYVLVSKGFEKKVKDAFILNEVMGSDHCPVGITW
jgi:exodeoxyribonuclease-3